MKTKSFYILLLSLFACLSHTVFANQNLIGGPGIGVKDMFASYTEQELADPRLRELTPEVD